MQGGSATLIEAVNSLTTLTRLELVLEGPQEPPGPGQGAPVVQLCLPLLERLGIRSQGSVDVRSCPKLTDCFWPGPIVAAVKEAAPWLPEADVPKEELREAYHNVWMEHPGPYASLPADGIEFGREGSWVYGRFMHGDWIPSRE